MRNSEIIERCTGKLDMSMEEAEWVTANLYTYALPDWSEWSWGQIDRCLKDVLAFKDPAFRAQFGL